MDVRPLVETDRPWLRDLLRREWGLPVVSISGTYDPSTLSGFVAQRGTVPLGALTLRLADGECEVVTLTVSSSANALEQPC